MYNNLGITLYGSSVTPVIIIIIILNIIISFVGITLFWKNFRRKNVKKGLR